MNPSEYDIVGNLIDTTFGRSSTTSSPAATHSVKAQLVGGKLKVTLGMVVNMATERDAKEMKKRYETDADQVIKAYVAALKSEFKDLAGRALKLKHLDDTTSLEIINLNVYNSKRTCLLRRTSMFEMS